MFYSQDNNLDSFKVKLDDSKFRLEQSTEQYVDYAKASRDADAGAKATRNYRSWAIIPDIVAIDVLARYGIDIHAPEFMHHPDQVRRFKQIIQSEFPYLLTSNIKKAA
jgi:DNA-binding LytR/AlgR family response regulator